MSVTAMCPHSLSLERLVPQRGTSGGQGPSKFEADVKAVEVPCFIQPSTASTILKYMQYDMKVSHTIYFDEDWDAQTHDRWVDFAKGKAYIVEGWYNSLELENAWVCDCFEIKVPLLPAVNTPRLPG